MAKEQVEGFTVEDYEGHTSYVCEACRGLFQTFDRAEAEAHAEAGSHPGAKGEG